MNKLLQVALKYLGQSEMPGNKFDDLSPLGKMLHEAGQKDGEAWCSYFGEGCAVEAYPEKKAEFEKLFDASAVKTYKNFKDAGYKTTTNDPEPGDLAIFQKFIKGVRQWQGHLCIVEAVSAPLGFETIDGNTNVAGSREGTTVMDRKKKSFKFNPDGLSLLGFVRISMVLLLIMCSGCGSNYYLKRAKINTYKAIARGAKIDSIKELVHDTIHTTSINDIHTKETKIDTLVLKELCPEVTNKVQERKLQKALCPDVTKDTLYTFYAKVDGKSYPIQIHFRGGSTLDKAYYNIEVKGADIPYVKEDIETMVNPGKDGIKWYHLIIVGVCCLLVGFVIGKVFSIGIKV